LLFSFLFRFPDFVFAAAMQTLLNCLFSFGINLFFGMAVFFKKGTIIRGFKAPEPSLRFCAEPAIETITEKKANRK